MRDAGFHFTASSTEGSHRALRKYTDQYGQCDAQNARAIVVIGGDGHLLESVHQHGHLNLPFFGLNFGSLGFLLNMADRPGDLEERIDKALMISLKPLEMRAVDTKGKVHTGLAYNEVSLFRTTRQAAKLRISIDGETRLEELVADGAMVSTPAGSTAYNHSAHGPIIPLEANLLALTPISPFRPRRWRGALLPDYAKISFDVLEHEKRPVHAVADFFETPDVQSIDIEQSRDKQATLLFDPDHSLDQRIIAEQFTD